MKILVSVFFPLLMLAGQQAVAGDGHGHGHEHGHEHGHSHGHSITDDQALSFAADVAKHLSMKDVGLEIGQLPPSWASTPKENLAISKRGHGYYIVAVKNKTEKKTLFVLMSSQGEAYDANFSGVFPQLK